MRALTDRTAGASTTAWKCGAHTLEESSNNNVASAAQVLRGSLTEVQAEGPRIRHGDRDSKCAVLLISPHSCC